MCDVVTALAPATAAGATLWAKNSDRPPGEEQVLEWLPPRLDERSFRATYIDVEPSPAPTLGVLGSRPRWGWGLEHGVNTAGVAAGNLSVYTRLDPRPAPPALTGMDLVRLALERGATAAGAVETLVASLERYGQGGSGHEDANRPYWSSFVVADAREAWVVDTSGRAWATMAVADTWVSSNRTAIPSFDAEHRHPRQPVERLVDPRLAAGRELLGRRPVTLPAVFEHLRSHDGVDGYSVCMHVPGVEQTNASMVALLPEDGSPVVWTLTGSPCTGTFRPAVVGPAPAAGKFRP